MASHSGMEFHRKFAHEEYLGSLQNNRVDQARRTFAPLSFEPMDVVFEALEDKEGAWEEPGRSALESGRAASDDDPSAGTSSGPFTIARSAPANSRPQIPYAPQAQFRRRERRDGAADHNKFLDFNVNRMPRMVMVWKEAGLRLSTRYFAKLPPKEGTGYALPVPEHLATIDTAFINTFLVVHELLILRLDLLLKYVLPLIAIEWCMAMGRGVLKGPSATNKRG
ncbi:hypothetical protein CYLTODRAFT_169582 [Cylindrobasidium torrendii FP15055 ss-10]|uniref:Uncharacterized protein n=1 Tax=Cylindrobasidium torrendii FP15055 ss-10 TaxID=1314674 RepID=A0A0D7AXA7_9AGAR|nr:hypothetical protein CYLTODRAFT_169582 [Cylindrobasidium torrendii FP15055 ss-10]